MKKFAIIGISIVLLISVVCVAAFAFWDTTKGEVTFTGSNIGSSITLKTTTDKVTNDGAGNGKNLVASDAVLGDKDATLVCVGAVSISIDSKYNLTELKSLIKSLKFNVTAFKIADNATITKDNYSDTFTLYLTADKNGVQNQINAGDDFHLSVEDSYKSGYKIYAFLKYKKVVDGAKFATKAIDITIQFVIE